MANLGPTRQSDRKAGSTRVGRPPGPSPRVRVAVVQAVADELIEHGFADLNVERVAARAGVARGTVYAHWPNRRSLVLATTAEWHVNRLPAPDHGNWPDDLRGLCTAIGEGFSQPSAKALLRTIMASAASDRELHAELLEVFSSQSGHIREPITRAKARGEIRAEVDANDVLSSISGPLFLRGVFADQPIDAALIDWVVASVLAATVPPTPG